MTLKRQLQRMAGVAGAAVALLLSGWAAASRNPGGQAHPATLAPIMATTSTGNGRPPRAFTQVAVRRIERPAQPPSARPVAVMAQAARRR